MKFRMMLSALLLAAGIVFVTGCSKKAETADAKKGDAKKTEVKAATPTDVAKKSLEAMKKLDFDTIAALSEGKAQENVRNAAAEFKKMKEKADNGDAQAKQQIEMIQKMYTEMTYEIKSEKIEGDFAVVEFSMTRGGKTNADEMHFKKVNGEWKGINKEDYKPAK